jgi:hypothetical protein
MNKSVPIVIVLHHFSVIDFSVLFLVRMSFGHRDLRLAVGRFFASCANLNRLQCKGRGEKRRRPAPKFSASFASSAVLESEDLIALQSAQSFCPEFFCLNRLIQAGDRAESSAVPFVLLESDYSRSVGHQLQRAAFFAAVGRNALQPGVNHLDSTPEGSPLRRSGVPVRHTRGVQAAVEDEPFLHHGVAAEAFEGCRFHDHLLVATQKFSRSRAVRGNERRLVRMTRVTA